MVDLKSLAVCSNWTMLQPSISATHPYPAYPENIKKEAPPWLASMQCCCSRPAIVIARGERVAAPLAGVLESVVRVVGCG